MQKSFLNANCQLVIGHPPWDFRTIKTGKFWHIHVSWATSFLPQVIAIIFLIWFYNFRNLCFCEKIPKYLKPNLWDPFWSRSKNNFVFVIFIRFFLKNLFWPIFSYMLESRPPICLISIWPENPICPQFFGHENFTNRRMLCLFSTATVLHILDLIEKNRPDYFAAPSSLYSRKDLTCIQDHCKEGTSFVFLINFDQIQISD